MPKSTVLASICTFLALATFLARGQTSINLEKMLRDRVSACYSAFEDVDGDGKLEADSVIDLPNGYLTIRGSWPTCGCSCNSTVKAFRSEKGKIYFLQRDQWECPMEIQLGSNVKMEDLLPVKFGIGDFTAVPLIDSTEFPPFSYEVEIPQKGHDIRISLALIPFGIYPPEKGIISYGYKELGPENKVQLQSIRELIENSADSSTITYLLDGKFDKISASELGVINSEINAYTFGTINDLRKHLVHLKKTYDIYMTLVVNEIILGWDKKKARFYIKEKIPGRKSGSFREFLLSGKYWYVSC